MIIEELAKLAGVEPSAYFGNELCGNEVGTFYDAILRDHQIDDDDEPLYAASDLAASQALCAKYREALAELLEDTQHAKHNCGDECCVAIARKALATESPTDALREICLRVAEKSWFGGAAGGYATTEEIVREVMGEKE